MTKRGLLLIGFGLLCVSRAFGEDFGDRILARVEQRSLFVRSYKANFDLWLKAGEDEFFMTGLALYKWPEMLRVEMSLRDQRELNQILYRKDGAVWQYIPSANIAFRRDEKKLREQFPDTFASQELVNLRNPFDLLEKETLRFLDEEHLGDKAMYLFEGVPKKAIRHQGLLSPALCRLRIAEEDGLLRDLVMYDDAGVEIVKQHFWDVQPNLEILDEEFLFRPQDVKLVEVTEQTVHKMELLLEEEKLP